MNVEPLVRPTILACALAVAAQGCMPVRGERAAADAGADSDARPDIDARQPPSPAPTWTRQNTGVTSHLRAVAYGSDQFVAVGDDGAVTRLPDGGAWTPVASGTTNWYRAIVFQNLNKLGFVAVGKLRGSGGPAILTSPDGLVWTEQDLGEQPGCGLNSVVRTSPSLVAVGSCGLAFSDAGDWERWERRDPGTPLSIYFQAAEMYRDHSRFVAIAHDFAESGGDTLVYTTNRPTANEPWPLVAVVPKLLLSIAADTRDDSIVTAVGTEGAMVRSVGSDALWQPLESGTTADLFAVAHCFNRWIAVGMGDDGGVILESDDGERWEEQVLDVPAPPLRGIGCGPRDTVVVGDNGVAYLRN